MIKGTHDNHYKRLGKIEIFDSKVKIQLNGLLARLSLGHV